jgi:hypothetical protein
MSKTVCPSLALHPIPSHPNAAAACPHRPVYNNILSFSIAGVTSEFLVIENENTISWQKMRYTLTPPSYFIGQK